jgi:hypothetical protein
MTHKKASGKSRKIKVNVLITLIITNLLLIFLLLFRLISVSRHLQELNEIVDSFSLEAGEELNVALSSAPASDEKLNELAAAPAVSDEPVVLSTETIAPGSYAEQCRTYADTVNAPTKRSESNVLKALQQMSADNEDIQYIYDNTGLYPSRMLENLVNNPEMTSYVKNYNGSTKKASAGFTEEEKNEQFPLLLQWDERWGYVSYGDESVIGLSGCGPTCLSMVLFSLTRDESLTPDVLADYAMNNGYYMYGTGTMWALFEEVPELYGVTSEKFDGKDEELVMQALNEGKILVFSVGPGDFTAYGHFILVYGIDEDGLLLVNDPNCVYRSTLHWDYKKIKNQIKGIWSFDYYTEEIV